MPAVQGMTGYPFFFPSLFGSGADGDLTLTTNSDVGYLGSYGAKQAVNATLAAGQTLTIGQGTSSGALIIACRGKLTIAGTITADGGNGGNATASGAASGAGGATCGGGAGGASVVATNVGTDGLSPTKFGHGAASKGSTSVGRGAGSGSMSTISADPNKQGANIIAPSVASGATYSNLTSQQHRLIHPASSIGGVMCDPAGIGTGSGSFAVNGTTPPVNPTTNDLGPWAQTATGAFLPLGFIPGGAGGFSGGVTIDGSGNDAAAGGGGGGGGVIIFEANAIELVSGYSITARGGNGGNGTTQGGTSAAMAGSGGWGGIVLMICRQLIGSTSAINCNGGSAGVGAGSGVGAALAGISGGFYIIKV